MNFQRTGGKPAADASSVPKRALARRTSAPRWRKKTFFKNNMTRMHGLRHERQRTGLNTGDRHSCWVVSNCCRAVRNMRCSVLYEVQGAMCVRCYLAIPLKRRTAGKAQGRVITLRLIQALPRQDFCVCRLSPQIENADASAGSSDKLCSCITAVAAQTAAAARVLGDTCSQLWKMDQG